MATEGPRPMNQTPLEEDRPPLRDLGFLLAWLGLGLILQTSCAGPEPSRQPSTGRVASPPVQCCTMTRPNAEQVALARSAGRLVGSSRIEVQGKRFRSDCSGLVRAVYFSRGIDVARGVKATPEDNGVRLIRRYIENHGRLHRGPVTQPGDLVFFHNTWDANEDRRANDTWTHIGIVERVKADGTVVFVSKVSRGIERYRMNLTAPSVHRSSDGTTLNDFLRRKRWRDSSRVRYLSGELFASLGTLTH